MGTFLPNIKRIITACQLWYTKSTHFFYLFFLQPKSKTEDDKRSERILTLILFSLIVIMVIFEVVIIVLHNSNIQKYDGVPVSIFTGILLFNVLLYVIARNGKYKNSGYIFIIALFACVFYASYMWGASLPMGLLAYGLIVTMASIIIDSRFGFFVAIWACVAIVGLGLLENSADIIPEWKKNPIQKRDVLGYAIMIGLTALLSRISNREMEKSLLRARSSEAALKEERDNLEILVERRTKALRESERERMRELYRFAEFGKLSGGIFHDLLNPLSAVSLSVSRLSAENALPKDNSDVVESLETAVKATRRMEQFMMTVKKQIKAEEMRRPFSLNGEIEDAMELVKFKAEKSGSAISFEADTQIEITGNPLKFNQVVTNLLVNAIDAGAIHITVSLNELGDTRDGEITFSVSDDGPGIPSEIQGKIFNPFFTTKNNGIGLGLSTTKDIIEEHFGGTISCESNVSKGTTFTINLPNHQNHEHKTQKTNLEGNPGRLEISQARSN